jgi:nucleotide-binding universal stress UspA family protein
MKVLIGVDGSQGAFRAVKQVGRYLQAPRDCVVLYCSPPEVRGGIDETMREKARQAIARAIFDEARANLPEALRAGVVEIVGTQNPGHGLVVAAEECRADIIAVGARGLGPLAAMLVGSVSREVVYGAKAPVLVVRESPFGEDGVLRVLAAYDGSNACRQALEAATRFAWPDATQAVLLSVIEPMMAAELPDWLEQQVRRDPETEAMAQTWAREHQRERQQRQEELAALARQLPPPFRDAKTVVVEGNADEQILAACTAQRADVVVVGARSQGTLERLLVGSTTERILAHAPCSVLVAREREKP